jgi:hypothetical protein
MKPGFILINNAGFIQTDHYGKKTKGGDKEF